MYGLTLKKVDVEWTEARVVQSATCSFTCSMITLMLNYLHCTVYVQGLIIELEI